MPRIAGDGPAQQLHRLALAAHAAAGAMAERDDPVDIREFTEDAGMELLGDETRRGGRAIYRGQDAEIVAGRHPAVGAHDPLEGRALALRDVLGRPRIDPEGVIAVEIAHRQIMRVDMLARADRLGREAEDLGVFPDRLAGSDRR